MKSIRFFTLLILSIFVFFSCTFEVSDDDDNQFCNFSSNNASGKLNNATWTYQGGYANIGGSLMTIRMFGMDEDISGGICNLTLGSNDRIFFDVPAAVGEYELNNNGGTITMYDTDGNVNYLISNGCMQVVSITDTEVTMNFNIGSENDYFLEGVAVITIC